MKSLLPFPEPNGEGLPDLEITQELASNRKPTVYVKKKTPPAAAEDGTRAIVNIFGAHAVFAKYWLNNIARVLISDC